MAKKKGGSKGQAIDLVTPQEEFKQRLMATQEKIAALAKERLEDLAKLKRQYGAQPWARLERQMWLLYLVSLSPADQAALTKQAFLPRLVRVKGALGPVAAKIRRQVAEGDHINRIGVKDKDAR